MKLDKLSGKLYISPLNWTEGSLTKSAVKVRNLRPESFLSFLKSKWATVQFIWQRSQQRRELSMLNEHLLKDIGVSRYEAHREANKWFWQN